ncbi:MAG: YIP1 family protein [bacterium]
MQRLIILVLLAVFVLSTNTDAKYKQFNKYQISRVMPVEKRTIFSLAGKWQKSDNGGKSWNTVYLPNSFNTNDVLTFKKTVKLENALLKSRSWHISFLGGKSQIEVYINDILIGKLYSNSTPFNVNIPDRSLRKESNEIKIVVYPPQDEEKQINTKRYFPLESRTGLFREMFLVGTSNVWIENVKPVVSFDKSLTNCSVKTKITLSSGKVDEERGSLVEITDSTGKTKRVFSKGVYAITKLIDKATGDTIVRVRSKDVSISSERSEEVELNFSLNNPRLWSVDNPNLYNFHTDLYQGGYKIDSYDFDYGFFSLVTSGTKFYLNNQKIKIKGLIYYEDLYGDNFTLSPKRILKDLKLYKLAGANAIIIKALSPNPLLLHYCDSLGILAFCELPVYNVPDAIIGKEATSVYIKNLATLMLDSYAHYCSLSGWGISYASGEGKESFDKFQNGIVKLIKSKTNKLIYKTVLLNTETINPLGIDFIVAVNNRTITNFYDLNQDVKNFKNIAPKIPLVFEYGTVCNPENHNGYSNPLSIFFQAYNISNCFRIAEQNRFGGSFVNSFNDYPVDNPLLITDNGNRKTATFGLSSRARKLRISFNTIQSLFTDETEPLLNAGSYKEKSPLSFLLMTIMLITVLFVMMNQLPRFREHFIRSIIRPVNFYADIRDQRVMSSFQTIALGVILSLTMGIFVVSILYINRTSEITQFILSLLIPTTFLKTMVFSALWQPLLSVFLISGAYLIGIVLMSLVLRVAAYVVHSRIYFGDCFTISVWASLPVIFLLPFNLFVTKIVVASPATIPIFILIVLLLFIWMLLRVFRSCSVVFNSSEVKTFAIGTLLVIILIIGPLALYVYNNSLFSYIQYMFGVLLK